MMRHTLPSVRLLALSLLTTSSLFLLLNTLSPAVVRSAGGNIVISEIQIAGPNGANDEFVELYNPSDIGINITGWRLSRRASGISSTLSTMVASFSGTIAPRSFYLVAHPTFNNSGLADKLYTATSSGIAANNTVLLFSDAGITVVDKVGMGTAEDHEASSSAIPSSGQSLERKASSTSTALTLGLGGLEELAGNAWDSDDNFADFVLRTIPQPQNSTSNPEPEVSSTPSPTSAPTPSPSPTLSPSPTPTLAPIPTTTPSPSPTATPTPELSPTIEPTPTLEPTPIVTPIPSPTILPSPTPTIVPTSSPVPTPTPSPTETPGPEIIFQTSIRGKTYLCELSYKKIHVRRHSFFVPTVKCGFLHEGNVRHHGRFWWHRFWDGN